MRGKFTSKKGTQIFQSIFITGSRNRKPGNMVCNKLQWSHTYK
ncbi:MAG: hypothetical protein ACK5XN_20750 [Bacteroidota bacterium]